MPGEENAVVQEDAPQEAPEVTTEEETKTEDSATPEGEPEKEEPEEAEKPKRKKQTAAKRISQLTWKVKELERQLSTPQERTPPREEEPQSFPTLEGVGYDEQKYHTAVDEYVRGQARSVAAESVKEQQQQQSTTLANQAKEKQYSQFFEKGISLDDDFADIATDQSLPITTQMSDTLIILDKGPEVMLHLAQNPDVAAQIAEKPPLQQSVELGRLEAELSLPRSKKTTSAPDPIRPVRASGESVAKDPDKMSVPEWKRWREDQIKGN